MVVGRAFAKRRQSVAPPSLIAAKRNLARQDAVARRRSTARPSQSGDALADLVLPSTSSSHPSAATNRPSIDFPTAVLAAARRLSSRPSDSEHSLTSGIDLEELERMGSPTRRRVVNISDHKTCALLMTKMKEANSASPQL
ncbi:hypothetical protein PFISCL1PPCAC_24503, partial [Pristionchus fissidentatus]